MEMGSVVKIHVPIQYSCLIFGLTHSCQLVCPGREQNSELEHQQRAATFRLLGVFSALEVGQAGAVSCKESASTLGTIL
jgi:hypothetical protein